MGYTYLGLGAFATGHLSLKTLKIANFWDNVDVYIGIGPVFNYATPTGTYWDYYRNTFGTAYVGTYASGGIGFASYGGANYFINDNLAVFIEGNYWGYAGSGLVGINFKF